MMRLSFKNLVVTLIALSTVFNGLPVYAQSPAATDVPAEAVAVDPMAPCFDVYPFGKLSLEITSLDHGVAVFPGDLVTVAGHISNPTSVVLPDARLFVRVLREEARVVDQHWHPIVDEFIVDNLDVPAASPEAAGEVKFSTDWHVPAFSPAGTYRFELSAIAADGSPLLGVPYVANVFGVARAFTVEDAGLPRAVSFDRAGVLFNNAPFVFRAVPPIPDDGPLTIVAPLQAEGAESLEVTVEKTLYSWSDFESDAALSSTPETITLAPGQVTPITFTWGDPKPGVYELILKATTTDVNVLPSLLRIRFYYPGTVPRILHVGTLQEADGSATVTACFFNSTFGPEGGSGKLTVTADGDVVQTAELTDFFTDRVVTLTLPPEVAQRPFVLAAEARDDSGTITDTEEITFNADKIEDERSRRVVSIAIAVVIGLVLVLVFISILRRRRLYTEPL